MHLVPDKYGGIECDRSGSRLRQREQFQKLVLLDPPFVDHFALYQRDHRIAATEGENADFQERQEKR